MGKTFLGIVVFQTLIFAIADAGFTLEQGIPHFNTKPYFLPSSYRNVTALEGQSAYLNCRVAQLGDKKVSWIRRRDLHVLTSGLHTFASDQRFQTLHADRSENWTLHIRFSQIRDTGEYQCQVNTEPRISTMFYLKVLDANTTVSGSQQLYVRAGSTIQLNCSTNSLPLSPGLLYWYRDSELVQDGGRVAVKSSFEDKVKSQLIVQKARTSDSGNYTCWPTKFNPTSVMVHVIPDEKPAAMSHGTVLSNGRAAKSSVSSSTTSFFISFVSILFLKLNCYHSLKTSSTKRFSER